MILCEALIDALTFWCAGFRNVTAAYGVDGFTEEHLAAFRQHDVRRVLIAYDRDEAGERGAAALAERLRAAGIACHRVEFPKGMDANAYALKVTPAAKSLGVLLRKAGGLERGETPAPEPVIEEAAAKEESPSVQLDIPASPLAAALVETADPAGSGGDGGRAGDDAAVWPAALPGARSRSRPRRNKVRRMRCAST